MMDELQRHPQLTIVTMDQMSLYFQATLTRVWAPRGQTPIVRVTPQRDHIHFYGALDVRTGREVAVPALEQTTEVTVDFIRELLLLFPTLPMLLLLDRAPWHHGPALDQLLADTPRLQLMYYPPACPELNPQEHVWEQARAAISHNHTYTDFEQLKTDFETFLVETSFETDFMQHYGPPIDTAIFE
ncbi:MAG: IS630 family transposase [Aggregatilineales bacterium]